VVRATDEGTPMSAAAAAATAPDAAPPKKGKKKLLIIIAAAVLVLAAVGGGAAVYVMKKKAAEAAAAAEAEADGEDGASAHGAKKDAKHARDAHVPPVFLPLEPFVVNLADREVDRFAQVGITLEIEDAKAGEQIKLYMPAIRNGILMILAHKTSAELLERSGKEKLAAEVARAAVRPMGFEVDEPEAAADHGDKPKRKPPKKDQDTPPSPVRAVHFSSFIIQ
jgi:flagellar protein FliL